MLSQAIIERILNTIPTKRIGLVGDLFLDRYLDIEARLNEPSVETGLTAYQVTRVRSYPGALGTVLNNLVALGVGQIEPVAVIGDDGEGYELLQALNAMPGVSRSGLIVSRAIRTPTYCKPMLNENGQARELNRLDIKNRHTLPEELEKQLLMKVHERWSLWDAVLILDQVSERNCGVITDRVRHQLENWARQDPPKFVLADSRERIGEFEFVSVKPNAVEAANMPRRVHQRQFITRGEAGLDLWEPTQQAVRHLPGYPVNGPIDICGAGDSCSAGIACGMLSNCSPEQAASFGNLVASITVQQIGVTGTASPEQVRQRWQSLGELPGAAD